MSKTVATSDIEEMFEAARSCGVSVDKFWCIVKAVGWKTAKKVWKCLK